MSQKGLYLVLEGTVGTGKSTQAKLLADYLKTKYPDKKIILTREPGSDEVAEKIRVIVQGTDYQQAKMDYICEAYLYAAARAQSLRTIVRPVLELDGIVVSDRSFVSSTAYQGIARGLGLETVLNINKIALGEIIPDLIIYLKLDPALGRQRTFDQTGDKFEKENVDFFKKIDAGYQQISQLPQFKEKWLNIDGQGSIEEVADKIKQAIKHFLPND